MHARDLVLAPDDLDAEYRRLIEDGSWTGTATLRRRDGEPVTYAATTSTLRTTERVIHLTRLTLQSVAAPS